MNLDLLFGNYELLLDTQKKIKELNQAILQLAVQGKLVPQDLSDEPASELIKRIKAEKTNMVGEVKENSLPPINKEEIPYKLPEGWEWVKLEEAGEINPRNDAPDDLDASFIPMNLIREEYSVQPTFEIKKWKEIRNGYTHFRDADVVVAKITPCFENSKAGIMKGLINKIGAGTTELHVFRGNPNFILPQYVYLYFKTPNFLKLGQSKMTGTAGQKRVPKDFIAYNPFPLPPFKEQKRIVKKVDELLTRTKEIEAKIKEREEQIVTLNSAALNHLLNSKSADEFSERFQLILDNFDLLYSDERNVKELKLAILTLAVQGKLVPQDPSDEPASKLLKKIKEEKTKLIKEGKIKKEKPLPAIKQEEIPYELPEGWEWVRLGDLSVKLGAGSTPKGGKSIYQREGIMFIRSQNVWNDGLRLDNVVFISDQINDKMNGSIVKPRDVLLNITGASIGRSSIVPDDFDIGNVNQHVAIIRLVDTITRHYTHICLISPYLQDLIMKVQVGISREGLSMSRLARMLIPLPPFIEQKRIVQKVDELLKLCNDLEAKLSQSKEVSGNLFRAILNGALNNNFHRENTEVSQSASM